MLYQYCNHIYPIDLFVCSTGNAEVAFQKLKFFHDISELRDNPDIKETPQVSRLTAGTTYLVRLKKTKQVGVLVMINEDILNDESLLIDTICHETIHVVDAFYQFINTYKENYDEGNEPCAYLAGWVGSRIWDYIKKLKNDRNKV